MPSQSDVEIKYSIIAKSGPDNPRNDTASVLPLKSGALMVVWHKYAAGKLSGSDFGTCRIYAKYSYDQGLTWQDERLLVDVAPGDLNVQAPALCRLPTGEILLICLRAHARNSTTMLVFRSVDEGENFVEISRVWERSQGQWLQGGASHLVLLSGGRLVLPFHGGTGDQGSQHNQARCAISDDYGLTWRLSSGYVDLPMRGAMEASVAELSDGRLAMSLRTQLGAVFMSYSDDGGDTWSLPQTTGLKAPESCTCLRRLPGSADLVLFWNDSLYDPRHHHFGDRTPLSAARSSDGGQTWRRLGDIASGAAEYTNLGCTFLVNGDAVLTYMKSPYSGGAKFTREHMDLMAAIIPRQWFER
ncbi:MAG TPA: exo-alpha-sialidase [Firmicutes bacterium]|nr:exo-alpha-sialidase [Bacillota bacterium]